MNEFYKNKVMLAPMAGVTDLAFRTICKECGADLVVSEMISSRGLHYKDKKTAALLKTNQTEAPLIVQLFGNDPEIMAESAKTLEGMGVSYLDINMGCPAPKIVKNGDGCALMQNEILAGKIAETVVQAVSVPVSVKFRAGWDTDSQNAVSFAKVMECSGVSAIAIHGRTKEQFYSGTANLEIIKRVKEAVSVPVIGNGDITDGASAKNMLDKTGCDSIMVGRGALGNPFIFQCIKKTLAGETYSEPTLFERQRAMQRHIELMRETKPERVGVPEMRKHFAWYVKGLPHSAKLKVQAFSAKSYEELFDLVNEMK
ncbi:tRNA dihydrouridine synthase DusB [Congzhengia minquanensis]|uniref:tRNA-dihydrouridine synthase n=1 Tax=Congzhengia minquanensis TaxID=2763657 RepID=A0A926DML8_9FIRM|nr:tRNA dihydrouridine synthase DusB [Congzhengia minquanensis]MBC8540489.1 tRNA dihydrouridine synthase DusB [Congzhengia minquanensis]